VIPLTIEILKLVLTSFPAGKQTGRAVAAAPPDFLAKVLQHDPTPLQSVEILQTAPSWIGPVGGTIPHALGPCSLQTSPPCPCYMIVAPVYYPSES